jgi:hypothetical protein
MLLLGKNLHDDLKTRWRCWVLRVSVLLRAFQSAKEVGKVISIWM